MTNKINSSIEIYLAADGSSQVQLRLESDTLWMTQAEIAELFEVTPQSITMHLKKVFSEGELSENSTCKEFLQVQSEGIRGVNRKRKHYNLDAIISVGYRVNSGRATQFRIWATQRLKEHLVNGYSLNQQRLQQNSQELRQALRLVEKTAASKELTTDSGRGLVELVTR